jgi:hypothetical protein
MLLLVKEICFDRVPYVWSSSLTMQRYPSLRALRAGAPVAMCCILEAMRQEVLPPYTLHFVIAAIPWRCFLAVLAV